MSENPKIHWFIIILPTRDGKVLLMRKLRFHLPQPLLVLHSLIDKPRCTDMGWDTAERTGDVKCFRNKTYPKKNKYMRHIE